MNIKEEDGEVSSRTPKLRTISMEEISSCRSREREDFSISELLLGKFIEKRGKPLAGKQNKEGGRSSFLSLISKKFGEHLTSPPSASAAF